MKRTGGNKNCKNGDLKCFSLLKKRGGVKQKGNKNPEISHRQKTEKARRARPNLLATDLKRKRTLSSLAKKKRNRPRRNQRTKPKFPTAPGFQGKKVRKGKESRVHRVLWTEKKKKKKIREKKRRKKGQSE